MSDTWSEWIRWEGGEQPLKQTTMTEVILRCGNHVVQHAGALSWALNGFTGDIAKYRYLIEDEQPEVTAEEDEAWNEAEKRMDVVGQNGNDGLHYDNTPSKYHVQVKGVWIDVYDVLQAFNVTNPALAHLIKKALKPGERGHKTLEQDMNDIVDSAIRAKELESHD